MCATYTFNGEVYQVLTNRWLQTCGVYHKEFHHLACYYCHNAFEVEFCIRQTTNQNIVSKVFGLDILESYMKVVLLLGHHYIAIYVSFNSTCVTRKQKLHTFAQQILNHRVLMRFVLPHLPFSVYCFIDHCFSVYCFIDPCFSVYCFIDHCFSFCSFCFGHCIVCPLIYDIWLPFCKKKKTLRDKILKKN